MLVDRVAGALDPGRVWTGTAALSAVVLTAALFVRALSLPHAVH